MNNYNVNSITVEYLDYYDKYVKKYGKEKTMVLMQVGSFYEAYATNERGPNLQEFAETLNIVCTRRDKSVDDISLKNPYMSGFPMVSSTKYFNILIDNGYTTVVIDQTTPPPNPKREVTNIYSPGTYIDGIQKPDTNYIVCLYLEEEVQKAGKNLLCAGMSAIDLTLGKVIIYESHSSIVDDKIALDETLRFVNTINPNELIIYYKSNKNNKDFIMSYLELDNKFLHYYEDVDKKYAKISYQNELLKKIYKPKTQVTPLEYLDLEKFTYANISFLLLLDFAYDHNEKIINNLEKPIIFQNNKHLILGNNAIFQLNIIENEMYQTMNNKYKSLFDVVNNTSTPLGRRYLKEKLLYPMTNSEEIQQYYNYTDELINDNLYDKIEKYLKEINDTERLTRKLGLNTIQPYELYELYQSYMEIIKINKLIKKKENLKKIKLTKKTVEEIENFNKLFNELFIEEQMKKQNTTAGLDTNIFKKGVFLEIDKLQDSINLGLDFMEKLSKILSDYTKSDKEKTKEKEYITVKKNDRDGYFLKLTKSRAEVLKLKLNKIQKIDVDGYELEIKKLEFKDNLNETKIFFPDLQNKSNEIETIKIKMQAMILNSYKEKLNEIYEKYDVIFKNINIFISQIDFIKSNAKTAKKYNYKKPNIIQLENKNDKEEGNENSESYLQAKNLRHPIIERLIEYEYIPHNVEIGKDMKGILLYGLNSSGKSSLMKAVGISLILAQAGMYVPAEEYNYYPYTSMYTRITGNDNIFKGLSSFALEMVELKAIMKRANPNTLVIGDEVCRSTEHISGNALVATSIIKLAESNASFIFATHLHEISKMERIKNLDKVKAFHISVDYDAKTDSLVYDRVLKEGPGEEIYGITVARHIIHDKEFIDLALEIKNELTNKYDSLISGKTSKYNSDVYVHKCEICGKEDIQSHISQLETHHINFQKDCEDGFVKEKQHIPKDSKGNLVVICSKCHDDIHNNKINVKGTIMTSNGKRLVMNKMIKN